MDGEDAVRIWVFRHDFNRLGIAFRCRIAENVNGIIVAPCGREELVEFFHCGAVELGQISADAHQGIRRQHCGAAGVGEDSKTRPLRPRLLVEHFRHIEELTDVLDAQDPATPEGGVEHFVASRQGSGPTRSRDPE